MKKQFLSLICIGLILAVTSCNEEETQNSISEEEAAEMIAMSLSGDAMGATSFIYTTVETSSNADAPANAPTSIGLQKAKATTIISKDTTITYSSSSKALITYSLTAAYSYDFTFGLDGNPSTSVVSYSYNGNFDASRLNSVHSGSGELSLSGLENEICTVNGNFKRTSEVNTKGLNPKQTDSEIQLTFSGITVNKTTEIITGGSATTTIIGTLTRKGDFEFSGTVVFEGNGIATLTVGDKSYSVNLKTGDYTVL